MKYNLDQQLTDHRGEPIANKDSSVTLGGVLEQACINGQLEKQTSETKLRQYKLAQKIAPRNGNELRGIIELTSEDVTLLKTLASSIFSAIVYGSIVEALENPTNAEGTIQ